MVRRHRDRGGRRELRGLRSVDRMGRARVTNDARRRCPRRLPGATDHLHDGAGWAGYPRMVLTARVHAGPYARHDRAAGLGGAVAGCTAAGGPPVVRRGTLVIGVLAATFEPPSTKDFVYRCFGPSVRVAGFDFCFNFILGLVVVTTLVVLALFYLAFRKPTVVPGRLQSLMELGIEFVRENIAIPMLGQAADRFMPLLLAFFFFILIGNLFEVFPLVNFSASSRVAIPLALALVSWVTYNAVGIRKHGFFG